MTDYALYENCLVEHFIAFSCNVKRDTVIKKSRYHAKTTKELQKLLKELLKHDAIST
jgi:hypothetical protein